MRHLIRVTYVNQSTDVDYPGAVNVGLDVDGTIGRATLVINEKGHYHAFGDEPSHWLTQSILDRFASLDVVMFRFAMKEIETVSINAAIRRYVEL